MDDQIGQQIADNLARLATTQQEIMKLLGNINANLQAIATNKPPSIRQQV